VKASELCVGQHVIYQSRPGAPVEDGTVRAVLSGGSMHGLVAVEYLGQTGTRVTDPEFLRPFNPALRANSEQNELGGTQAWGTALKPAIEPWVLARKPISEANVTANVLRWGTGALNIEATRAGDGDGLRVIPPAGTTTNDSAAIGDGWRPDARPNEANGRWPANVVTLEPDEELRYFRASVGQVADFAKASAAEKPWGGHAPDCVVLAAGGACTCGRDELDSLHPTVKPLALMSHLVRLVTPPGGRVLDPFAGTGTTGEAAVAEGFDVVLIEQDAGYTKWIKVRLGIEPSGSFSVEQMVDGQHSASDGMVVDWLMLPGEDSGTS
jgi:hypothetical protein